MAIYGIALPGRALSRPEWPLVYNPNGPIPMNRLRLALPFLDQVPNGGIGTLDGVKNVAPNRMQLGFSQGTFTYTTMFGLPAVATDGSSQYARIALPVIPGLSLADSSGDYTVLTWVSASSFENFGAIFACKVSAGPKLTLQRNNAGPAMSVFHDGSNSWNPGFLSTDFTADGLPHLVILQRSGTAVRAWFDGRSTASTTIATDPASGDMTELIFGADSGLTANAAIKMSAFLFWDAPVFTDGLARYAYAPTTRWSALYRVPTRQVYFDITGAGNRRRRVLMGAVA